MKPHEHFWLRDESPQWQKCSWDDCDARRHTPLRDGNATVCPARADGEHQWQPVSFRFETQLLDSRGRVSIRQPDTDNGRVYMVCVPCRSHTYMETAWVGYFLGYPFMETEQEHYNTEDQR